MDNVWMDDYDIIVIGAGHAGCEAALAAARMGNKTAMFSINLEAIAMMPCNPSVGGTGKGHLVREIDALGGEMAVNADKAFIQSRMLNMSKGPAVHSLRVQADKAVYHREMKRTIERQENLDMKQGEIVDIDVKDGRICGVITKTHAYYGCRALIIATGTFLAGKVFIGEASYSGGPNGLAPAAILSDGLRRHGMKLRRFKTGTPARALASSFDYSKMKVQHGDEKIVPFSFMTDHLERKQADCWLTYTNETTHKIIRENYKRSGLYTGEIVGTGPRYCPSIETKIERFPDRPRHQLFIEPEGEDTEEMYIQGMSTSLPEDVQRDFYHSIEGLENIRISRPAYAIEYDCIDPLDLKQNLEYRGIGNIFCAGQFNGSSGYEEAAAQGLMAGINASLAINGKKPFVLGRNEAYIGVLIDDLVTKGTNEPYRIMTSRAEYRLLLRQDNADSRLTEKGYRIGLVSQERYDKFRRKEEMLEAERKRVRSVRFGSTVLNPFLEKNGIDPVDRGYSIYELLKRPEITYDMLAEIDSDRPDLPPNAKTQLEVEIKYEGYIGKQLKQADKFRRMEERRIPADIDYSQIDNLKVEARQKLEQIRPTSVGQASRISGVSPADMKVLMIWLEKMRRMK